MCREWTQPTRNTYEKLKEQGHSSPLNVNLHESETELQPLVFVLLGLSLSLVQSSLTVYPFLSIGLGVGILCHCMLERYNLFCDFTRCVTQETALSVKSNLGHLNRVQVVSEYGNQ